MSYDPTTKDEALKLYVEVGASEAARRTDCSVRSVRRWASEAGLAAARDVRLTDGGARLALQHTHMREELRVRLLEKSIDMIDRMDEPHTEFKVAGNTIEEVLLPIATSSDVKNYASALQIFIDKYRLEMGEHTSHTRTEGTDDVDRAVSQLVGEHERRSQTASP